MSKTIKIGVVSENGLNLHGFGNFFIDLPAFEVVCKCRTRDDLIKALMEIDPARRPRILLLDFDLNPESIKPFLIYIKKAYPEIAAVALGLTLDYMDIAKLVRQGSDCYVQKKIEPEEFVEILHRVDQEGCVITPLMKDAMAFAQLSEGKESGDELDQGYFRTWESLSDIERKYTKLMLSDKTDRELRIDLNLPDSEFAKLVKMVYQKFNVNSREGLIMTLFRNRVFVN